MPPHADRRGYISLVLGALLLLTTGCQEAAWFAPYSTGPDFDFAYQTGGRGDKWLPEIMGAGVAMFDYDQDDDLDLYFTNGNSAIVTAQADPTVTNQLFAQQTDGTFVNVTEGSGLDDGHYGMGVAVGDIDNDGDEDVYLTNLGPDQLYVNQGDGTFENGTVEFGIDVDGFSASAAFCDYDQDGYLDLYVNQYLAFDPEVACFDPAGRPDYCGPAAFDPIPDRLLQNVGGTEFRDVSEASGIASKAAHGLGVICEDLNQDGWLDFVAANDGDANYYWINQGDGTFEESATRLGIAFNQQGDAEAGMGVFAADLDTDGWLDVFMTHLHREHNTLFRNRDGEGFEDIAGASGLGDPSLPYTGFGTAAFDIEHDGDLDVVVANGRVRSHGEEVYDSDLEATWQYLAEPNQAFLNSGTGQFAPLAACGPLCDRAEISRGLAAGDLDGDGDIDLAVANIESSAQVFENVAPKTGDWLRVRAIDPEVGRVAIGARVVVSTGDVTLVRPVTTGYSYLSASEPVVHFGLPANQRPSSLEVVWPDGTRERFPVSCLNCTLELMKGEDESVGG